MQQDSGSRRSWSSGQGSFINLTRLGQVCDSQSPSIGSNAMTEILRRWEVNYLVLEVDGWDLRRLMEKYQPSSSAEHLSFQGLRNKNLRLEVPL